MVSALIFVAAAVWLSFWSWHQGWTRSCVGMPFWKRIGVDMIQAGPLFLWAYYFRVFG